LTPKGVVFTFLLSPQWALDCRALIKYRQETSAAQQEADKPHKETNGKAPPPPPSNDPSQHPSQSHGPNARKSHNQHTSHSHPQIQSESKSQNQHVDRNGEAHSTDLERAEEGMGDEMADTLSRIHTPNAADDRGLTASPEQSSAALPEASPEKVSNHRDSHVIDMPSDRQHALPPPSCSASSVHGASAPAKSSRQPASSKKADTQDLKNMEEGSHGTDNQTEQKMNGEREPGMQHSRMSSRRKLNQDEFFRKDFMLAPSSYACEYEPDIAPDKLADIYTGVHHFSMLVSYT